jgi:Oxidoreductin, endoplasmic reticulum membrane-associated protein involved in disulfide bond formation
MCNEERLLFKLISGLHACITTQISEFYVQGKKMKPNTNLFFEAVGNYEDRIKNLYFAYSFIMRAINRAHDLIENYNYDTGNENIDLKTKTLVKQLLALTQKECSKPFDESEFFSEYTKVRKSHQKGKHN